MAESLVGYLDSRGWAVRQPANFPSLIIGDTFQKAVDEARAASDDPMLNQLQAIGKMEDVVRILKDAEMKHHDRPASKAWKWASRLSSNIMHFGNALDIIAQHHSGHLALVWGTLRFILMGVVTCDILLKELCKALSHVVESLRLVQLNLLLYPTDAMKDAAAKVYLHILAFMTRALKWYEKSRLSRVLSALTGPFQLKFRDTVEDILDASRSMDRLALSLSQVENRQMRLEITETRKLAQDIKSALEAYSQLHYSGLIDTNRRISEVQFCQILNFLAKSSLPDPERLRHHYASKRNLRRRKQNSLPTSTLCSSRLQEWGALKDCSQILVQGSFRYRQLARDFAVDMIDLITKADVPVVWALHPTFDSSVQLTSVDVLKHITLQVLRLNHTMLTEQAITLSAARFQSTVTESGWFSLLGSALEGLPQLYIIIDLEVLDKFDMTGGTWLEEFSRLFNDMSARHIRTILKIAFVSPRGTDEYNPDQIFGQSAVNIFSGGTGCRVNATTRRMKPKGRDRKGRRKLLLDFQLGEYAPGSG